MEHLHGVKGTQGPHLKTHQDVEISQPLAPPVLDISRDSFPPLQPLRSQWNLESDRGLHLSIFSHGREQTPLGPTPSPSILIWASEVAP